MRSMTGFGRGTAEQDGNQVAVEISAVNSRKQTDIRFAMPRELGALEAKLRKRLQDAVHRGSLTVLVTYETNADNRRNRVHIDSELGMHLVGTLKQLAQDTGISDDIRVSDLLLMPGLVSESLAIPLGELERPALEALDKAIADLHRMQSVEGEALRLDFADRHTRLQQLVTDVDEAAPQVVAHYRDALRNRIEALGVEVNLNDERLAKEVAFMAERSDVTEEAVRLRSHLEQFRERIEADEPVGRVLEFLCQEMSREASTICAKGGDCRTAEIGLQLKTELARIREQVMNVE